MVDIPEMRFAQVGEDRIAYQVFGEGPPDLVYMSGTVPQLMAGSNVEFEPRGEWALKGIPGEWPLYAVRA